MGASGLASNEAYLAAGRHRRRLNLTCGSQTKKWGRANRVAQKDNRIEYHKRRILVHQIAIKEHHPLSNWGPSFRRSCFRKASKDLGFLKMWDPTLSSKLFTGKPATSKPGSEVGERPAMSEALSSDASGLARMEPLREHKIS